MDIHEEQNKERQQQKKFNLIPSVQQKLTQNDHRLQYKTFRKQKTKKVLILDLISKVQCIKWIAVNLEHINSKHLLSERF